MTTMPLRRGVLQLRSGAAKRNARMRRIAVNREPLLPGRMLKSLVGAPGLEPGTR